MAKFVYGKDDALFGSIETQQGDRPFGNLLDAGTGLHSLRWIATLPEKGMTSFTAITADETMRRNCQAEIEQLGIGRETGNIIIGNWFDDTKPIELEPESFDTIIADYLIGAMDGFSPFKQDEMIPKLVRYLKPNGKLYIIGLEPIPDSVEDTDANIMCKVRQIRDACILLAGHRCYREYPVTWIHKQMAQIAQLNLLHTSRYPILYRHSTIQRQINVARSKFPYFPSKDLADSMAKVLDDLDAQALEASERRGTIALGFDYIVTAEKI